MGESDDDEVVESRSLVALDVYEALLAFEDVEDLFPDDAGTPRLFVFASAHSENAGWQLASPWNVSSRLSPA